MVDKHNSRSCKNVVVKPFKEDGVSGPSCPLIEAEREPVVCGGSEAGVVEPCDMCHLTVDGTNVHERPVGV